MVNTSSTAQTMIQNFAETRKIYEQGKEYYDRLRSVSNLVRSARKVQQCILMVGQITDTYVNSYDRMLADPSFSDRELAAIASGYTSLLQRSADALKDLQGIVNPSDLSMTDKDRLDVVDKTFEELSRLKGLTDYFTRKNIAVSQVRAARSRTWSASLCSTAATNRNTGNATRMFIPLISFDNLHEILRSLYQDMMPCAAV